MWKTTLATGKWLVSTQPAAWICSLSQSIFPTLCLLQSLPDNVPYVTVFVGQWPAMLSTAAACWHRGFAPTWIQPSIIWALHVVNRLKQASPKGSSSHLRFLCCCSLEMSLTTQATPATKRNKELHSKLGKTDAAFRNHAALGVLEGSGSDSETHSIRWSLGARCFWWNVRRVPLNNHWASEQSLLGISILTLSVQVVDFVSS